MRPFSKASVCFLLSVALCLPCLGNEVFHLVNGFEIEALSHQQDQDKWILQTRTGSVELPVSDVASIEPLLDGILPPPGSTPSNASVSPDQALQSAAATEGLPVELLRSVAHTESGYQQNARSSKGALGLMQLMPSTAKELGVSPEILEENAEGGAKYLRQLLLRYQGDAVLALAAYNAGPDAVKKYGGVPPYAETRQYVRRVLGEYLRQQKAQTTNAPGKNQRLASGSPLNKPNATN